MSLTLNSKEMQHTLMLLCQSGLQKTSLVNEAELDNIDGQQFGPFDGGRQRRDRGRGSWEEKPTLLERDNTIETAT